MRVQNTKALFSVFDTKIYALHNCDWNVKILQGPLFTELCRQELNFKVNNVKYINKRNAKG